MNTTASTIEKLRDDLRSNPDLIDEILVEKFDLDSLINGANNLGYQMSDSEIEAYLNEKSPAASQHATTCFVEDPNSGEFRELTEEELEAAAGGVVGVLVAAAIVAVAVTLVGAVSVVLTGQVTIILAVALSQIAVACYGGASKC